MATITTTEIREIISITTYWFHTHNGRRVPTAKQHWRYYLRYADQTVDDLVVTSDDLRECSFGGDLCVAVADRHGIMIGEDQVQHCWPRLGSCWQKGF